MRIMTFGLGASRTQDTAYSVHCLLNPHLVEIVRAPDMSETAVADPASFDLEA